MPRDPGRLETLAHIAASCTPRLLETNSARVVNDLIDRFVESCRQLEHEVASSPPDIGAAAERAARHARVVLSEGRERVAAELERLAEYARL